MGELWGRRKELENFERDSGESKLSMLMFFFFLFYELMIEQLASKNQQEFCGCL